MRSVVRLLAVAVAGCVAVGCGTTNPGTGSGGGSSSGGGGGSDGGGTGGGSDAGGAATDAGTGSGGGATDAGTGSGGGAADGGTGSGGGGSGGGSSDGGAGSGGGSTDGGAGSGGGADAGTTASDCEGLAPQSLGTMQTWSTIFDGINGQCGLAIANGFGTIAQMKTDMAAHPSWFFIDASTGNNRSTYSVWHGDLWPVPGDLNNRDVFYGYVDEGAQNFHLSAIDPSNGAVSATTPSFHLYSDEHAQAGDPRGGMFIAGAIQLPDGRPNRRRVMTQQPRVGPRDLPRDAPVFGLGGDLNFKILVIQAGDCDGCIDGQWFDGDRQPIGDPFRLLNGFVPGQNTWFETAPIIGGGVAIRRVDFGPQVYPYQSQWLVTLASGSHDPQPAPQWLASRPNTNLALARNGKAYAVLPNGERGGACEQRLELVSPSGNSCASWTLNLTSGSCDTSELRLGMDGTILQHTPTELERNPYGRPQSCTLRYWPAALR